MRIVSICIVVGTSLSLPFAAFAQSPSSAYCQALSQQYTKLVADPNAGKNHVEPPADVATAQSKCASDPASAVPVLEKALTDKKITLPPRT